MFWAIMLVLSQAIAWSAAAEEMPKLIGTWKTQHTVQSRQGQSSAEAELVITEQTGPLFRATNKWKYRGDTPVVGDDGAGVGKQGEEAVLGVIGWDGKSINMADAGDKGFWFGELADANTMRLVYVESQDHATVFRAIFVRQPAGSGAR
jgi:hypothetical protein